MRSTRPQDNSMLVISWRHRGVLRYCNVFHQEVHRQKWSTSTPTKKCGLIAMFEQPCQRGYLPLNPETLTIENKPVTISGDPSKLPNDNIKTKLKNNSTPTTQEACDRASITSQVLKGINQLLWTLPPHYQMSLINVMLVSRLTTPPTQRALPWLLQKRWVHSPFPSRM